MTYNGDHRTYKQVRGSFLLANHFAGGKLPTLLISKVIFAAVLALPCSSFSVRVESHSAYECVFGIWKAWRKGITFGQLVDTPVGFVVIVNASGLFV